MAVVVRVRFRPVGGLYDYEASAWPHVQRGDFVVVPTQFGPQVGEVMQVRTAPDSAQAEPSPEAGDAPALEPVLRRASARDLALRRLRKGKEVALLVNLRARLKELAQKDRRARSVRIVEVELSLDDRHVRVLYTDEDEERNLAGHLRRGLQRLLGPRQVHWVRVGPRDAAKIMGGVGACGMTQRCCSLFMTTFQSVSVRMAKVQNISLSPTEITGMCGRLRCCLRFENEQYVEARKGLPRERKWIHTPEGEGRVVAVQPLTAQVTVDIPEKGRVVFSGRQLQSAQGPSPCDDCPQGKTAP